jgi:DNA-binding transcriptional ArsR family regulator
MTTPYKPKELDKVFESLGNQHRREIVYALGLQPHSTSQLASMRGLSLPAIHKHIKILEDAALIKSRKLGRTHFLTINRQSLKGLQNWLMQYQAHWGNNEETLENYANYLRGGEKKK